MKKIIYVISLLLIGNMPFYGQEKSFKDIYYNAESFLDAGNYSEALTNYQELSKMQPDNDNINFKIGFCYVNTILDKDKSIQYLEKASKNISEAYNGDSEKENKAPVDVLYWLGKAYHVNYKFEEAIKVLNEFRPKIEVGNPDLMADVDKTINYCQNGIELIKKPVKFNITNLGSGINTEFSEHSPVFSADESVLIFTSKREGTTGGKKLENGEFYEDIYISNKNENGSWSSPNSIGTNINTDENEATIGLSIDGQTLFIYKDDNGDGNIYSSQLNGDVWSVPEKLGPTINTKSRETHACLSADGRYLYFTSDRKGGLGGLDIYVVKRLPNGQWSDAQNLGSKINTPNNEEGPFIHPDGVTLFFSSEGHKSLGGYDIFYSVIDNDTRSCSEAKNIGYPINTTENDVFYVPTPDGKRAYYSSYQANGLGSSDLYLITLPESQEKPLVVMSGKIETNSNTIPKNVTITVTNLVDQSVVGNYTPNSKTGKYLFILTPGKYNVLYESDDNLYFSENITVEEGSAYQEINKAINLSPVLIGDKSETYLAEFDAKSSTVNDKIEAELSKLYELLKRNKQLIVDIQLPSDSKNKKLNDSRKKSVVDNLEKRGLDKYRTMSDLKVSKDQDNVVVLKIVESTDILATNDGNKNNTDNTDATNKVVKAVGTGNDVEIDNVFFDFNKAQTTEYYENLNKLAGYLVENNTAIIEMYGYTDLQGDEDYNMQLSIRRASFVKDYLIEKGVSKEAMKIKGFGESNQIAIDLCPESRKYNRRVEFKVTIQGNKKLTIKQINVPENYKIN
ncbi:MAG: hypothetical protein A2033_10980 [Bacteroidetes bacterium GWA2_31_9]|nr:MAG: hypothetical protein A2033_10980 [Bacteroidetes bacterium GWA2_31_9]